MCRKKLIYKKVCGININPQTFYIGARNENAGIFLKTPKIISIVKEVISITVIHFSCLAVPYFKQLYALTAKMTAKNGTITNTAGLLLNAL